MSTAQSDSGANRRNSLELTSYTRRDDGGTKASYLDPNDRTKSMVEIWIPFSGEDRDESGKEYLKRTATLPAKINLIRGEDTDGVSSRERHLSEPQYASSNGDTSYENDTLTGRAGSLGADSTDPLYGTLRSQSSWKSAPHSITSLGTTMASPYDHYTLREEERRRKKKRRWPWILCCLALVILSILAVVLAVLLTTVLKPNRPVVSTNTGALQDDNRTTTNEPTTAGIGATPTEHVTPTEYVTSTPTEHVTPTWLPATTRPPPVNGRWSAWQEWSRCSKPCGGGEKTRRRRCNNPEPQNGGRNCSGDYQLSVPCNTHPCPDAKGDGYWGNWGNWSVCTKPCGGGNQVRKRLCNNPAPKNGGADCVGVAYLDQACNSQPCVYTVTGTVADATDNKLIKDVLVSLAGHETRTDDQGKFSLSNMRIREGSHTLVARAPNYAVYSRQIQVQRNMPTRSADILLSPIISKDGFRVVLTWGDDPIDLDLYVLTPYNCRIYYNNHRCEGSGDSQFRGDLDVDDVDGYGPETITLRDPYCGDTYVVYVGIFSKEADPKESFNGSRAQVQLYNSTTLMGTVDVPKTGYDPLSKFWHVLNITPRRNDLSQYTVVNKVQTSAPSKSVASQLSDRSSACDTPTDKDDSIDTDTDADTDSDANTDSDDN